MRRRILRWGLPAVLIVFAALQVVQPDRSRLPVESDVVAPQAVREILRRSCFDCHSHETSWPWYGYVAPVSWWLADHVEHGRKDLNFSRWPTFDLEAQEHIFEDIDEQIREETMPLRSYLLLHRRARLSAADREALLRWAGTKGNDSPVSGSPE